MKMTKKLSSLDSLLLEELGDLLNAETQLVRALPRMTQATSTPELKEAMQEQLEMTRSHVNRLEAIFRNLGQKPMHVNCEAMKSLIKRSEEIVKETPRSAARDAALIDAVQRVGHYEIAGYGTARSHASLLGHQQIQELLGEALQEEREIDARLNRLAESFINLPVKEESLA